MWEWARRSSSTAHWIDKKGIDNHMCMHGSSHTHTYSGISQNTTTRWAWLIRKLKTESSPFLKWNHNFTRQNRQQPSEAAWARKSSFLNVHSIRKRRPRNRDRVSEKKKIKQARTESNKNKLKTKKGPVNGANESTYSSSFLLSTILYICNCVARFLTLTHNTHFRHCEPTKNDRERNRDFSVFFLAFRISVLYFAASESAEYVSVCVCSLCFHIYSCVYVGIDFSKRNEVSRWLSSLLTTVVRCCCCQHSKHERTVLILLVEQFNVMLFSRWSWTKILFSECVSMCVTT